MLRYLTLETIHSMRLMRQSYLHRWLAVLFLIFAVTDIFADILSPQLCCEWIDNLATLETPESLSSTQVINDLAALSPHDSKEEQSSTPLNIEEDCFCCCSHILPSIHFDVALLNKGPSTLVLTNTPLPIPPPQTMFHPPRFS